MKPGVCEKPVRLMRRVILDYPDTRLHTERHGWLRVRDEGDKITFTYKEQLERHTATGIHEVETSVGSFENTVALCEAIGLQVFSFQESKRETWQLGDCEVVLDEWPWVKPYIEVEGPTEASVKEASEQLGFSWDTAVFGGTTAVFRREYPNIPTGEDIVDDHGL